MRAAGAHKWSPHLYIAELLLGMMLSIFFDPSKLPLSIKALIIGATSFFIPYICYHDPHHCLSIWPLTHLYEALSIRDTPAMALVLGFVLASCLVLYIAFCYVFTKFITLKYERSTTEYKIMTIGAAVGVFAFLFYFVVFTSLFSSTTVSVGGAGTSLGAGGGIGLASGGKITDKDEDEDDEFDPFDEDLDGKLDKEERKEKKRVEKLLRLAKKDKDKDKDKDKEEREGKDSVRKRVVEPSVIPQQQVQSSFVLGWLRALKKSYLDFAVNNPAIYYGCWLVILSTCAGCAYLIWKENMIPVHHPALDPTGAVPPMAQPPGPGLAEQPQAFAFPAYIHDDNRSKDGESDLSADDESEHEAVKGGVAESSHTPLDNVANPGRRLAHKQMSASNLTPSVLTTRSTAPSLSRRRRASESKSDRETEKIEDEPRILQRSVESQEEIRSFNSIERLGKRQSLPALSLTLPASGSRRVSPLVSPRKQAKTSASVSDLSGINASSAIGIDQDDMYQNPTISVSTSNSPRGDRSRSSNRDTPYTAPSLKRKIDKKVRKKDSTKGSGSDDEIASAASASEAEPDSRSNIGEGNDAHNELKQKNLNPRYLDRSSDTQNTGDIAAEAELEEERGALEEGEKDALREDELREVIKESISEELSAKFWQERERALRELEEMKQRYEQERTKYKGLKQTFIRRLQETEERFNAVQRSDEARRLAFQQLSAERTSEVEELRRALDVARDRSDELAQRNDEEREQFERVKRELMEERKRNEEWKQKVDAERQRSEELQLRLAEERDKAARLLLERDEKIGTGNDEEGEDRRRLREELAIAQSALQEEKSKSLELYAKIDEERQKGDEWRDKLEQETYKVTHLKAENENERKKNEELRLQIDEMSAKMTEILMNVTHLNIKEADGESERLKKEKQRVQEAAKDEVKKRKTNDPSKPKREAKPTPKPAEKGRKPEISISTIADEKDGSTHDDSKLRAENEHPPETTDAEVKIVIDDPSSPDLVIENNGHQEGTHSGPSSPREHDSNLPPPSTPTRTSSAEQLLRPKRSATPTPKSPRPLSSS